MSVDSPLPASSAASLEAMNAQRRLAMQRFLRTDGCRRSFLLHAMGSEPVECSGCDHCDRRLADDIVAVRLIGAAVRKNRRSMSRRAFCRLLSDRLHARDRDRCLHHNRSRGLLCGWSINEVDEVLTAAIAAGSVRVHRRGPWKGMVDAPRFRRVRAFLTTGGTGGMV